MFQTKGMKDYYTGTREGFPTIEDVGEQMRQAGHKRVQLIPFMFVLIRGTENTVTDFWQKGLRQQGFDVDIYLKPLGENPAIRSLFIDHIRFAMKYKRATIFDRKKLYTHWNNWKIGELKISEYLLNQFSILILNYLLVVFSGFPSLRIII